MIKRFSFFCVCVASICCHEPKKSDNRISILTELPSPAGDSCAEPYLVTDSQGAVMLSWIEKNNGTSTLKFSSLQNEQWAKPITIAAGNNWFVNWADYPVIASDGNNNFIAHFLEKRSTGKYAYDVKLVASDNKGLNWSNPVVLHDDGINAEHGFVSLLPYNDGFFVSWLDGRNSPVMEGEAHEGHHGQMSIRAAILDNKGIKQKEWELDNRVCDCCQTTAAITANGPVVIYRDRSGGEVRDMSIVRLVNGAWTAPQTIHADNWKIDGCPVNGPRSEAIGNSVAVAWFTMIGKQPRVNLAFSGDGGQTFNAPIRVDEGNPIGRVDVAMLTEKTAMVCWMEDASIKAARIAADGKKGELITVASASESRSSGFPQMVKAGNKVFFAWTDDKKKTIKVAFLTY